MTCPMHNPRGINGACSCTVRAQRARQEARALLADAVEGAIHELERMDAPQPIAIAEFNGPSWDVPTYTSIEAARKAGAL